MSKIFKTGDYVLLSDCREFDDMHGLTACTTEKLIAEKMNHGSVKDSYLEYTMSTEDCVGMYKGEVGLWVADEFLTNRLSVEEVLYRSGSGLTVARISEIRRVDEKRKSTVKKAVGILNKTFGIDTAHECICEKLYDAGVFKC